MVGDRDPSRPPARLNEAAPSRAPTRTLNAPMPTLSLRTRPQDPAMNALQTLPERALRVAGQFGDGLRDKVPDRALKWVETGAALAAVKTGGRMATRLVRRNPAMAVAAVAGAGLLWMAARHRKRKMEAQEPIEGSAKRVDARRATARKRTSRRAQTKAS